ncbi:MAG: hypothetical protein NUV46_03935 [Nanoarchaeota archaeon]|nr:hypothetical protein [Nanoarchaeota archaeon]
MKKHDYGEIGEPIYTYSEEPKKESKLWRKILTFGLPLLFAGTVIYGSQPSEIESKTLKYQGWYEDGGKNFLVFDEKSKNERVNGPKYKIVSGITKNLNDFETNRDYRVKIEKKNFGFVFPDEVTSIEEVKSD